MEKEKISVRKIMTDILLHLNSPQESRNLPGNLANIRHSIGKSYEEASEVWSILFPLMPTEGFGNGKLTKEEKAIIVTLQLYALGQQGTNKVANSDEHSFGSALHHLRDENSSGMDRRFNVMITATTFDEFAYHLRQLFTLGKGKHSFTVNYPALAEDLFWYQMGQDKRICLTWAKDYYRSYQASSDEISE